MEQIIFSPKSFGNAIKRRRKEKKLSQEKAGSDFRINQTTISSIELGAPGTRLDTVFRVLAALDLEMIIRPKKNTKDICGDRW
jgi:HTH-type transcriptional regulator / antitoxin HipB